jgi:hypothetical protein
MTDVRLRTIHHLSASGGTVISKAIAALPRVVLLSELNPSAGALFAPRDPFAQVITNYPGLFPGRTLDDVFLQRIEEIAAACAAQELSLVVRDHSHTDFLMANARAPRLRAVLDRSFVLQSIATVRNPVDAWLSMSSSGFNRALTGFTAYCDRVKLFLDAHADMAIFRYEDFTAAPAEVMAKMAEALGLTFDPGFAVRMDAIRVTGDSGRLKQTTEIKPLGRRELPVGLSEEIARSENRSLLERMGYQQ